MRGIEAAFWGTLGRDPELRTSRAGKPFCGLALAVTTGKTDDGQDVSQWVRATCFGENAERIAASCRKGDRLYCEGNLTLNGWTDKDGQRRHGLNLAAWKAERVAQIGKNREKRERDTAIGPDYQASIAKNSGGDYGRELNDEIPF